MPTAPTRSRTVRRGLAVAVALTLTLATACSSSDDGASKSDTTTTTAAPDGDASPTPGIAEGDLVAAPKGTPVDVAQQAQETPATSPATVDDKPGPITGEFEKDSGSQHEISVPSGVTAIVTISPLTDVDLVITNGTEQIDSGKDGEPEILVGIGSLTKTIKVASADGTPGRYQITLLSAGS